MDDVRNGFHLDTLGLVDVFEGVELLGLLVLDDANLAKADMHTTDLRERATDDGA